MSTVVALDIGSSSLAGAEVKDGRALVKAAVEPLPEGVVVDGEVTDPAALATHIRRFWREAKFSGRSVRLGVANQRVVVRTVDIPALDDAAEQRATIEAAAFEQIPISPDQAILDYQSVDLLEGEDGPRMRVVVVAAHREMVDALIGAVRRAGLRPSGIDLEAFALIRAFLPAVDDPEYTGTAQVVCHIGASMTNIVVAVDRVSQFTRLVGLGGVDLTNAVADQTGLPAPEAEALKSACGLLGELPEGADQPTVSRVRHALALAVRPLVQEIGRTIDFYRSQEFARPIDRLVLSGGTALCAGLDRYVQQALGIPVVVGDPLQNLARSADLGHDVASRAAVAVGLALDAPEDHR
jgi:type IV pilus assembly protein PilM